MTGVVVVEGDLEGGRSEDKEDQVVQGSSVSLTPSLIVRLRYQCQVAISPSTKRVKLVTLLDSVQRVAAVFHLWQLVRRVGCLQPEQRG